MFGALPRFICLIIFSICLRPFSSWLTCWTVVPDRVQTMIANGFDNIQRVAAGRPPKWVIPELAG